MIINTSNETSTIKFEMSDRERPMETLIRMAKSLNPRQMQLSSDLNAKCAFDLPGLNKIKWWTKDGNKIMNPSGTSGTGENSNISNTTGNMTNGDLMAIGDLNEARNKSYTARSHGTSFLQSFQSESILTNNNLLNAQNELCFTCQK